jgi:deoxyadenosine/deoxycytidine kinase
MIVGVSGNLATGKTTLTKIIEKDFGFVRVAENPQENEFLPDFYADMQRWSLESQLTFIISRSISLLEAQKKGSNIVIDRTVSEDVLVFCHALNSYGILGDREFRLVRQTYDLIRRVIPFPDLYVYLEDTPENIIGRIYRRAIPYEQGIEHEYIKKLADFYERWLTTLNPLKIVRINTSSIDFRNPAGRQEMGRTLEQAFLHF